MRRSARATWWNYGAAGWYFITICTLHRIPFFGRITDGRMIRNEIGNIVVTEWENSPALRPDMNLALGEYIVMPDHFHAIIGIGHNLYNGELGPKGKTVGTIGSTTDGDVNNNKPAGRDAMHCVPTDTINKSISPGKPVQSDTSDHNRDAIDWIPTELIENPATPTNNQFGPQSKNLAAVIRGFKASVTRSARVIRPDFTWQSRYHDHIIRNAAEYKRIERYIIQNPSK